MSNLIPSPCQRLSDCARNIPETTKLKILAVLVTSVFFTFLGGLILTILGITEHLPQNTNLPLIIIFAVLTILFAATIPIVFFCKNKQLTTTPPRQPAAIPPPIFLGFLRLDSSVDSGLGGSTGISLISLDDSRSDLNASDDSGIDII